MTNLNPLLFNFETISSMKVTFFMINMILDKKSAVSEVLRLFCGMS